MVSKATVIECAHNIEILKKSADLPGPSSATCAKNTCWRRAWSRIPAWGAGDLVRDQKSWVQIPPAPLKLKW